MNNKIIITNVYGRNVIIHLMNDRIERIRVIKFGDEYSIGSVVIGKVKKLIPSSNACFVNLGTGTDFFLSLPENIDDIVFADTRVHTKIKCDDEIVVQVTKEAVKTKQPTVSADISIAGRYFVASPGKGISYSKKISKSDIKKIELPEMASEYSAHYHLVFRTEGAMVEDISLLESDLKDVYECLDSIFQRRLTAKCFSVLYKPQNEMLSIISEWLKYKPEEIVCDSENIIKQISAQFSNSSDLKINYYTDDYPLAKLYGLESGIDSLLNQRVYLRSGAFLVVEQGETLTAIDVNSAHAVKGNKEDAVYKINMEAADEIAHIMKSRNLSGMILVDFINMKSFDNEKNLINYMKNLLEQDEVKAHFVDMTGLGLMEITRQRKYNTFAEQWKHSK